MSQDFHAAAVSEAVKRVRLPHAVKVFLLLLTLGTVAWTVHCLAATPITPASTDQRPSGAEVSAPSNYGGRRIREVEVVRPMKLVSPRFVELEGSLAPRQLTQVASNVPGNLAQISVRVGEAVKAGARLAQLEPSQARAQFAASAAQVRAASAQLLLLDDHAARSASLVSQGAMPKSDAVQSELQRSVARAQLDVASAQHTAADVALREHTLRAPFSGTVISAPEGLGLIVSPGQPLFELADLSALKLSGTVSEAQARQLRVGDRVVIETELGEVEGHLSAVLEVLEEQTRRAPVQALFEHPGTLRAGSFVRARAEVQSVSESLRLPASVLRPNARNEVLVVVPGYSPMLSARRIAYTPDNQGHLQVQSGIHADDAVVIDPPADFEAGEIAVIVRDVSSAALK